jgi:hypothetical protein
MVQTLLFKKLVILELAVIIVLFSVIDSIPWNKTEPIEQLSLTHSQGALPFLPVRTMYNNKWITCKFPSPAWYSSLETNSGAPSSCVQCSVLLVWKT